MNSTSVITKSMPRPEQPARNVSEATTNKITNVSDSSKVTTPNPASPRRTWIVFAFILIIAIAAAVVLAVVLTRDDEDNETSTAVDFETGVSLVTYYGVNSTITSRLARTILTVVTANALDCASIHGITIQLPLAARVASLKTMADDGCNTYGKVQTLEEARETFVETASHGLPGAYVEERDSFTHSLQVAMPPLGTTRVELVLEELLHQRVGQVEFQVPFTPNEEVDQVELEVSILNINQTQETPTTALPTTNTANSSTSAPPMPAVTEGTNFHLDLNLPNIVANATNKLHLELPNARQFELPKVLSGYYKPAQLPENGAFFTDDTCFEHYFLPNEVETMPKNIVFLLDISDDDYDRLQQSKKALKNLIDSLTPMDSLTIQAFAERGTEKLWGKGWGTEAEKTKAKEFVNQLDNHWGEGTDLQEAYLEGLLRAKRDANVTGVVSILVMLSNSEPSRGETDRAKIASAVWKLNQEGKVKMFSLAFRDSDRQLLNAIAIMNGGVAFQITDGHQDYASQMQRFFESQFGDILLSDIQVKFTGGDTEAYGQTRRSFPVLADGSEVVVRGLLTNHSSDSLNAVTTAVTKDGEQTWTAVAEQDPFVTTPGLANSRCFQSYAHSRITQLMHWRDAAELLGDEVLEPVVFLVNPCAGKLVDCIEQEALSLAIKANVVAEGLTGMVTMDDDQCQTFEEETEICLDGTSAFGDGAPEEGDAGGYWTSIAAKPNDTLLVSILCCWLALLLLLSVFW